LHIYQSRDTIAKTIYHAIDVTSTKAELFSIRCGINQAVQVSNAKNIIVITDTIHTTRQIFDSLSYSYQLQTIAIAQDLREFFNKNTSNTITFWDCSSSEKWCPHLAVDKETKQFHIDPIFPCKVLWDFSKREECDLILHNWQMIFQASDYKGNNFLYLIGDDFLLTYTKGGAWLNHFGHFNTLCVHITGAITNHAPIGEYYLRFFPRKSLECLCGNYPIKSRHHILHNCRRYNKFWNPNRESVLLCSWNLTQKHSPSMNE